MGSSPSHNVVRAVLGDVHPAHHTACRRVAVGGTFATHPRPHGSVVATRGRAYRGRSDDSGHAPLRRGALAVTGARQPAIGETPSLRGADALAHRYRPILLFDSDEQYAPVDVGRAFSAHMVSACHSTL